MKKRAPSPVGLKTRSRQPEWTQLIIEKDEWIVVHTISVLSASGSLSAAWPSLSTLPADCLALVLHGLILASRPEHFRSLRLVGQQSC